MTWNTIPTNERPGDRSSDWQSEEPGGRNTIPTNNLPDGRRSLLSRLARWITTLDWRREVIYPLTAAMEVAWFTPWYMALIPATGRLPPGRTAAGLFLVMVIPAYAARGLGQLRLQPRIRLASLAGLLFLTCLLALRVLLYAGQAYSGLDWLATTLTDVLNIYEIIPDWLVIVSSTLFLWWRGLSLGRRRPSVRAVAFGFYVGIVAFIGFVLVVQLVSGQDPAFFIPVFFFVSLVALGATRMEQMRGLRGAIRSPFGLSWLAAIAIAALAVVLLATLLGAFMAGRGIHAVVDWVAPLLLPVGLLLGVLLAAGRAVVNLILAVLDRVGLERTAQPVTDLLRGLRELLPDGLDLGTGQGPSGVIEAPAAVSQTAALLRVLVMVGVLVGLGALVIWMARGQSFRQREEGDVEHASLFSSDLLAENLRRFMHAGHGRLAALLGVMGRSGLHGLFAVLTIRRIYARMLRLAAEQGYPRLTSQTPYEYEPTAIRAFPEAAEEVRAITVAYVAVHYGEVPETDAELEAIRTSWQRLKDQVKHA